MSAPFAKTADGRVQLRVLVDASQNRTNPSTVGGAVGSKDARFVALMRKERRIAKQVARLSLKALRRKQLLSANAKTSVSLDFAMSKACEPTLLCARVCYASSPSSPLQWEKTLRLHLRNVRYFQLEDTASAVPRLSKAFRSEQKSWAKRGVELDYLRINGTGDLFPEFIPVLNGFAQQDQNVRVWVVTRKFNLAAQIERLPNIYIQLSLDSTTEPPLVEAARGLVANHPRAYISFLRANPDDDTLGAAIVFNEKKAEGLPDHGATDCPVDADRLPLGNVPGVGGTACSTCRKCFSEPVLHRRTA